MAAVDPHGDQKYWVDGVPFPGVNNAGNDPGTTKFWVDGVVEPVLFPASAGDDVTTFTVEGGQGYTQIQVVAL